MIFGKSKHVRYYFISTVRGIVEIFSLGFLFIIPDIVASVRLKREIKKQLRKSKKEKNIKDNIDTIEI